MTEEEKAAAAAAAAKAAAEKAAADKAAADKAAADKAAAEAEEARKKAGLSEKEAELLKEVMEKKGKLKEAQDKLKAYDGIDPEEYKALKAAKDKAEAEKVKAEEEELARKGEFDRLKQRMAEQHDAAMKTEQAQKDELKKTLAASQGIIEQLTVGQAFQNSSFIADEMILTPTKAKLVYGTYFETENGVVVGYDKPRGAAERTKMVDARGEPIAFEDALKKIVETDSEKDKLLKSKLKQGANSSTVDGKSKKEPAALRGLTRIQAALALKAKGKA